ncbi:MAG: tetratricopeptide repeat protein [Candidatus Niyogibacteria bacterium]|nr:tetratricopeptide repeat protein [Candidatus Niyogibacteria bacterium]
MHPSMAAKIIVVVLILAFYGALAAHRIRLAAADDLGRHLKTGETVMSGDFGIIFRNFYSYTEPDFPTYNHHWLSGVAFYLLHQVAGFGGLVIFKITVLVAALALLFRAAMKKADFWLVAFFSLLAIFALSDRTDMRPEIFSYFFIAIYIYFLADLNEHPEHRRIFWLVPLQILWINMHIFFSIGLMLAAGFLAEKIILNWRDLKNSALVKRLVLLFIALVAASSVNPLGFRAVVYDYQLHNLGNYPIRIAENEPTLHFLNSSAPWASVSASLFLPMILLLAASFALAFYRKERPIFYLLASIGSAGAGFFMTRGVSLFALVFLPAISANLNGPFLALKERLNQKMPDVTEALGKFFGAGIIIALVLFIAARARNNLLYYRGFGVRLSNYSEASAEFFRANDLHGPIFNDTDIGSYLIYEFFPSERVFTDNRFGDAYSKDFFNRYMPITADEDAWARALKNYKFNVIYYYHYDAGGSTRPFLWRRTHDPAWALVYADPYVVILLKNTPENKKVIDTFRITGENAGERLNYLSDSEDPDEQIAAGDLLNLVGRDDLAMEVFKKVVRLWPERSQVWLIMGEMVVDKNDWVNGIAASLFFEKAVAHGAKTAEAYSYLSLAYVKTGQFEKADIAARKALAIDPNYQSAKDRLEEIEKYFIPADAP